MTDTTLRTPASRATRWPWSRPARVTRRPRRTWRRSSPTGSAAPSASTCPATRAARAPTPGLRAAIGERALALDICQDIEGIDTGPKPTPYERAESLAADAYGAERCWFLTNGATQGNHALTLALAKPGCHVLVQRNSHASVVDGLVLSGGMASFVSPEYDDELGMAHGVTPEALDEALRREPEISAVFIVSPTYYGMAADIAGLRRGRPPPRRRADRRHRLGLALRIPPGAARFAAAPRRRRGACLHAQDRRLDDPVSDAARRRDRTGSTPTRSHGASDWSARRAPTRCCSHRWTPPGASSPSTARRCWTARSRRRSAPARRSTRSPGSRSSARAWSGARASPAGTRCGS